jgi:hypothetical protein
MRKTLQLVEKQAGNRAGMLASAALVQYGYARPVKQDFTRHNFSPDISLAGIMRRGHIFPVIRRFRGSSR